MTRFNDSATDTLEYVAEHGARFTWSDFKVVQTDESAYYVWNPTSKTYMWSGRPTFSYRLDIDKNVRDIVFVSDGTLPDIFVMDDGEHGPVDYNANMASQNFDLDIYCARKDINLIIYISANTYLTIANVEFKKYKCISFFLDYISTIVNCQKDIINKQGTTSFSIDGFSDNNFLISFENENAVQFSGMMALNISSVFSDVTIVGKVFTVGQV